LDEKFVLFSFPFQSLTIFFLWVKMIKSDTKPENILSCRWGELKTKLIRIGKDNPAKIDPNEEYRVVKNPIKNTPAAHNVAIG